MTAESSGGQPARGRQLGALVTVLVLGVGFLFSPHASTNAATSITDLHVSGNAIVNPAGQTVRLVGVDRSGTEYACIQGWGFFDGPSDLASVQAMVS